jgi:hypothetical protein
MRGCSGRRPEPFERAGSRGRAAAGSTAGRTPELLPSLLGYAEMTGSCASVDALRDTDSDPLGSLEGFAPPSGLPKILVRSPNVAFPYLRCPPRDGLPPFWRAQFPSTTDSEYHTPECRAPPSSQPGASPSFLTARARCMHRGSASFSPYKLSNRGRRRREKVWIALAPRMRERALRSEYERSGAKVGQEPFFKSADLPVRKQLPERSADRRARATALCGGRSRRALVWTSVNAHNA